jgi:chemotaxis protein methyltransferase CheR
MTQNTHRDAPEFNSGEYLLFSDFLRSACGIDLGANKQYLVATRVRRILLESNLGSLGALTTAIASEGNGLLRQKVIDAMTTNETFWFRDVYPFQYLATTVIPEISAQRQSGKIKVWSAACSTGQEPYSISMVFDEVARSKFGRPFCDGEVLGTDLSSLVLDLAKEGCYDRITLARGLSDERRKEFFTPLSEELWQIKPAIRNRVRFRPINLQDSYFSLGKFDLIYCRNVLIYFSADLKIRILKKLHASLVTGGYLFLGSSESITGLNDYYEMINCNPGIAYRAKAVRPER